MDVSDSEYLSSCRDYLASCRDSFMATRTIADTITDDIPELRYVLGKPTSSVVAFRSKHSSIDAMSRGGWHLQWMDWAVQRASILLARFVLWLVCLFEHTEANPFLALFYSSISMFYLYLYLSCFIVILPYTGETHRHAQRLMRSDSCAVTPRTAAHAFCHGQIYWDLKAHVKLRRQRYNGR